MVRSSWKGLFFESSLYRIKHSKNLFEKRSLMRIWCRRSVISTCFLDYKVQLYNGQKFYNLILKPEMSGMKWGCLAATRCGGGMGRVGIATYRARQAMNQRRREGRGKRKKK